MLDVDVNGVASAIGSAKAAGIPVHIWIADHGDPKLMADAEKIREATEETLLFGVGKFGRAMRWLDKSKAFTVLKFLGAVGGVSLAAYAAGTARSMKRNGRARTAPTPSAI